MKTDWKPVVAAFIVGILIGGLFVSRCPVSGPKKFQHHMMDKLSRRLQLTPEQKRQISAISEETRRRMEILRDELRPRFQQIRNESREKIRKILTPEQQSKFDALTADMHQHRKKHWDEKSAP